MPSANTVAQMQVVVTADTSAAESSLSSFSQNVQSGIGMGAGFGLMSKGLDLVSSAFSAAKASVIDLNSSLQQSKIAFTTMLGGAEQADDFLKQLQAFAAQTPFEFPDLVTASKRMLAFGFESKNVVPLLTAVGDAVAAVGGGAEVIDGVTTALGQMQAKGKVSAEEMGQLAERGIPAWDMLAKKMGVSIPEAMEAVSKGAVKAGTFIEAFQEGVGERFGGMMAKQSQTFAGAMSTITDSLQMATAKAFEPLFVLISELAVEFSAFVQSDEFNQWAAGVTASIGTMIGMIRELLTVLKPAAQFLWENRDAIMAVGVALATFAILTTVIGWVTAIAGAIGAVTAAISASGGVLAALGALVALLGGPVTLIVAAVALAVGALYYAWSENFLGIQDKTAAVVEYLSGLPETISGFWDSIVTATDDLMQAIEKAWEDTKKATETIWNAIKSFLVDWWRTIVIVLAGPVGALAVLIIDNWETISTATETIWNAIKNVLTAILTLIHDQVIAPAMAAIGTAIETAWNTVKTTTETVLNGVLAFVRDTFLEPLRAAVEEKMNAARDLVGAAWDAIKSYAESVLNPFLTWIRDQIFEPIRLAVETALNGAKTAVETALNGIKTFAETTLNPFLAWWRDQIFTPMGTAVSTAIDGAKTAFETAVNGIKTAVDNTMGGVKTAWETTWNAIKAAAESPEQAMKKLIELVGKLKEIIPDWLIPHSPTPFQVGIEGIMSAAKEMDQMWRSVGKAIKGANGEIAQYIAHAAAARGIDPGVALRIAQHEGGLEEYNKVGKFATGWSWWPFQLHYGGKGYEHYGTTAGMGNTFTKETGWAPGDPKAWKDSVDYALNHARKFGWSAWYGRGPAGVGAWEGIPGHAAGGWVGLHGPELGWLGEKGPEYVVPNHALGGGASSVVRVDLAVGGRVAEQIYIQGRELAIRRGRVPSGAV